MFSFTNSYTEYHLYDGLMILHEKSNEQGIKTVILFLNAAPVKRKTARQLISDNLLQKSDWIASCIFFPTTSHACLLMKTYELNN